MSVNVSVAGSSYAVPQEGDSGYATDVTNLLIQLATSTKVLQVTSSSFPLTQDLSFGSSYGLKIQYIKSQATNPSSAGVIRLGNAESVGFRNAANNADLLLTVNASDILQYNGTSLTLSGGIVNADINAAAAIAYSKLNLSNSIVNADISSSASIALSKLAALSTSRALQSNSSTGAIEASSVTNTELSYLSGVTSAIQTQLGTKVTNPMTTGGDVIYGGASGVPTMFRFFVNQTFDAII